jgi:hypothetical protein
MRRRPRSSTRVLPDGTPLHNRLLAALSTVDYKQDFLVVMLGVHRPTVTIVLRALQETGMISSRYGRMRVLRRRSLEAASCECYGAIRGHFARLGL